MLKILQKKGWCQHLGTSFGRLGCGCADKKGFQVVGCPGIRCVYKLGDFDPSFISLSNLSPFCLSLQVFFPFIKPIKSSTFSLKIHHKHLSSTPSLLFPSSYLCFALHLVRESEGGRRITTLHLLYSLPQHPKVSS